MTTTIGTYLRRQHVALLALFVALGGTSYAAVSLAPNSVATKQIKNGQVKAPDLGTNVVTSSKIKDGSLTARDFAFGQLPVGPRGPAGQQGEPGAAGAPATKLFLVSDESGNVLASSGLTTQDQTFVQTGKYRVQFDRDVTNCAPVATITGGRPAFISATLASAHSFEIDLSRADTGAAVSQGFSLAVFC